MKEISSQPNLHIGPKPPGAAGRKEKQATAVSVDARSPHGEENSFSRLAAKTDVRYWRQQLVLRAHCELARPRPFRELSARIEYKGDGFFFPVDTGAEETGAVRALQIYRTVRAKGWPVVLQRFPREITFAIFWADKPVVCTYATLYTAPAENHSASPSVPGKDPQRSEATIAIIEPDDACRASLANWIRGSRDYTIGGLYATEVAALNGLKQQPASILLFNRQNPQRVWSGFVQALARICPRCASFPYQIYNSSDNLFISQPGNSEGYYFRRRAPERLLEPIQDARQGGACRLASWRASVTRYVQDLFRLGIEEQRGQDSSALSARERSILECLGKGNTDKEIAITLGISAWTVHTHLKNIFKKLAAHSRTEAVIKYLQR